VVQAENQTIGEWCMVYAMVKVDEIFVVSFVHCTDRDRLTRVVV
jgi:hypothetical protein